MHSLSSSVTFLLGMCIYSILLIVRTTKGNPKSVPVIGIPCKVEFSITGAFVHQKHFPSLTHFTFNEISQLHVGKINFNKSMLDFEKYMCKILASVPDKLRFYIYTSQSQN